MDVVLVSPDYGYRWMAQSLADAFLEAILQDPDDDTPRLVFADWLEEQGDPANTARAEFVRVQCALARGGLPLRQRVELTRRERQLLDEHGKEWVRPVRRLLHSWKFHRGFLDEVEVFSGKFVSYAGRLFRRAPIQRVHLAREVVARSDQRLRIAALADCEHLRRVRALDLSDNRLETRDLRAFVVSEHLASLTALNLSHNRIGDGGIRALAGSPLLGRLEHLNLRGNDVGANGLRALTHALEELTRSPEGLRLQRLELATRNLSTAGKRVVADSPLLRRLVRG
jgi:uncharacterized protein (TIGR02996 family)